MDGTGRWRDLNYEKVYLGAYEMVSVAQQGVARYLTFYNQRRPHQAFDGQTPDRVYWEIQPARPTAA